ncbi:hypothetical protein GQ55_1G408800 [Panicum hallii var. hallii]|uniref:Uncharacterized protein n=1 Tax=Panicum hallii var. hallii TaxID=1504633 RepID=A0A2T7FCU3_9POAL|nr:hypothetical protein GQ55_1G408800 [Panicum hallii var. hallii]
MYLAGTRLNHSAKASFDECNTYNPSYQYPLTQEQGPPKYLPGASLLLLHALTPSPRPPPRADRRSVPAPRRIRAAATCSHLSAAEMGDPQRVGPSAPRNQSDCSRR